MKMSRYKNEAQLRRAVQARIDAYDNADAPAGLMNPAKTQLLATNGNPAFVAQFDITMFLLFFTVNAGVYTNINAAALLAAQPTLATRMPAFVFGNSDFSGGFSRLRGSFPLSVWQYDAPFVFGTGGPKGTIFGELDATARALLNPGDLVIPITAVLGGVNYVSFTVVRCTQVAYGTLLDALSSDRFVMNMIRYIMADTTPTGLAQFNNNVQIFKQSLYGKFDSDFVAPNSYKLPEQMQSGIIDIPLVKGIDKQIALASWVGYNVGVVQWSIFVAETDKLSY